MSLLQIIFKHKFNLKIYKLFITQFEEILGYSFAIKKILQICFLNLLGFFPHEVYLLFNSFCLCFIVALNIIRD